LGYQISECVVTENRSIKNRGGAFSESEVFYSVISNNYAPATRGGAATKSTSFTVFFTKTVNGVKHTATSTFTIDSFLVLTLHVDGSGSGTLATVAGAHPAFAKVALKAKADPGSVFAYWYELEGGKENVLSKSANFTFEMVGIPEGASLVFIPTGVEVKVIAGNQVEYQGKSYALSAFAAEFMPDDLRTPSGAYQGPKFFSYNGESLVSLRALAESGDSNY
jgi:hypothetical protein